SFCDWSEKIFLSDIQKLIKKTIPVVKSHSFDVPGMHDIIQPAGNFSYGNNRSGGMRKRHSRAFTQRA
ncbi:MAG TPA: ATP-dependent helicase, partial [Chitinophagaceae bacterium]|nr:ATP-dependent helicase [Chitinophagaceae bacterium]